MYSKFCHFVISQNNIVGNNEIGAEGAVQIASGLKENKSIKQFCFGANKLNSEGIIPISEALHTNTTLIKLDLCIFLI